MDLVVLCGVDIGLCFKLDFYCKFDDIECVDFICCRGICVYKNIFVYCGGYCILGLEFCEKGENCIDDFRNLESCGMVCDGFGVCFLDDMMECEEDGDC